MWIKDVLIFFGFIREERDLELRQHDLRRLRQFDLRRQMELAHRVERARWDLNRYPIRSRLKKKRMPIDKRIIRGIDHGPLFVSVDVLQGEL